MSEQELPAPQGAAAQTVAITSARDGAEPQDLWENPMGTRGFEFVEFATDDAAAMDAKFRALGFTPVARHRSKDVTLYRQGKINFIVNAETTGRNRRFVAEHGPGASAMAFRVKDARLAFDRAIELGAHAVESDAGPMELRIPAIEAIGGALVYLVDRSDFDGGLSIYDVDFKFDPDTERYPEGAGLTLLDHLTHNVYRGRMDYWAGFYEKLFNFKEIRYFDIEGKLTGLKSKAMTAPDGQIRIPINESADDKSQIEEYLLEYRGEGIQHIALHTDDIYSTVDRLRKLGVTFMTPPPDTYYEALDARVPGHGEPVEALKSRGLLLDGAAGNQTLLQIFTETVIGPIFFEIIQRKGDEGFGEGNFKALFESMERDQIRRGVLQDKPVSD